MTAEDSTPLRAIPALLSRAGLTQYLPEGSGSRWRQNLPRRETWISVAPTEGQARVAEWRQPCCSRPDQVPGPSRGVAYFAVATPLPPPRPPAGLPFCQFQDGSPHNAVCEPPCAERASVPAFLGRLVATSFVGLLL